MSPRPRTVDDAEVIAGAGRVVLRVGPERLTLAEVGREVGLSPATLIQRFGSRRQLLLAFAAQTVETAALELAAARLRAGSPLAALIDVLVERGQRVASPEAVANNLAFLQLDLSDPDFLVHARDLERTVRAGTRALLDAAVAAGDLVRCDTARLARAVRVVFNGALMVWAVEREGTLADWLRDELAWLLGPYRTRGPDGQPSAGIRNATG